MPRLLRAPAGVVLALSSCALVAVLVLGALSLDAGGVRYLFLGAVAVLAVAACFAVPVESLPTVALVAAVLVPDRIADYSTSPIVTPATVALGSWVVRKLLARDSTGSATAVVRTEQRLRRWLTGATVVLAVGMVPLVLVSPNTRFSVAWAFTFVVAVVAPLLLGDFEEEARRLRRALPWLGSSVAAYAIIEHLIERNVLYAPLYRALGLDDLQHWSVYRSDASLGHPLVAGLFFSVLLAFCVGRWLESHRRGLLVAALLNGLGIVATVSRGSYIAAAVAVATVLLVALCVHSKHRFARLLALLAFIGASLLAVNSQSFVERGLSSEGLSSLNSRNALPEISAQAASASHWLGGGPASSLPLAAPYNFQNLPIENSYLQLLIGIGAWGLALFVLVLVLAAVIALRRRNLSGFGALVGYGVAIAGFAALDSRRDLVVLLGLLVMMSLHQPDPVRTAAAPAVAARAQRPTAGRAPAKPLVGTRRPDVLAGATADG